MMTNSLKYSDRKTTTVKNNHQPVIRPFRAGSASGFTMIEVLVVVAVMVSLLGLVIGMSQYANAKAALSQCDRDLDIISSWLVTEYEEKGLYPPGAVNLNDYRNGNSQRNAMKAVNEKTSYGDITVGSRVMKINDFWRKNAGGSDIKAPELPFRDPWGMDYVYIYPIPHNLYTSTNPNLSRPALKRYLLGSRGPNRKLGDNDQIADYGQGDDITSETY